MSEYLKLWIDGEDQPLVLLYRLKNLASQLPSDRFMQVHRSYLVNLSKVREIGRSGILLDNGKMIPIGNLYRPAILEYLSQKRV